MDFIDLVKGVQELNAGCRQKAASAINVALTARNWLIGAWIVEFEQDGQNRASYGDRIILELAEAVQINGLGRANLARCRQFYQAYPQIFATLSRKSHNLLNERGLEIFATVSRKFELAENSGKSSKSATVSHIFAAEPEKRQTVSDESATPRPEIHATLSHESETQKLQTVSAKPDSSNAQTPSAQSSPDLSTPPDLILTRLSFSQIVELLKIDEPLKRTFYEIEAIKGNWSVRELKRQIGSLLYERTGLSTDKEKLIRLTDEKADKLQPADIIRDPYVFEFVGLRPREVVEESELEQALLDDLQTFLLELGRGFCFEERQKRIQIGSEYYFVDLVFYHRLLKCHVLIDLKTEPFQHSHPGQLNTYVNYFRKNEMAAGDQPPIGLLLCTQKDASLAEYALGGMDENLFVSSYQTALPDAEELKRFLDEEARRLGIGGES